MTEYETLGGFLKRVLQDKQLSGNLLAKSAGIAETSVRNLLKFGIDPDAPAPHPQTLRAVAEFLHVEPIWLLQLAGYLPRDQEQPSAFEEYIGRRIGALPDDKQAMILEMVATLEKASGIPNYGKAVLDWLPEAGKLRKRRLTIGENIDKLIGRVFKLATEETFLSGIQEHLAILYPDQTFSAEQITHIAQHPVAMAIMGVLLPRKDMPTGLERLFYLTWFDQAKPLKQKVVQAIRDTWELLVQATQ
jgi:transcriptional regulator with XRE-family HTH domain